jgi:hypothetical protein
VAEDVRNSEAIAVDAPTTSGADRAPSRAERARRGAYRYRFAAIYFVLAAVVGAAVGSFVVLASRDDPAPAPQWSAWEPDGSSVARVKQIADRVPRGYSDGGRQLVLADGGRPQLNIPGQNGSAPSTINVSRIAVLADTSRGQAEEGEYDTYDAANAITFRLCGGGESCSIAGGTPSANRLRLLRREALELSLYTFRYVDDIDSVVVFLPPAPPDSSGQQQQSGALFLRRNQVANEIENPLTRTLPAVEPPAIGGMSEFESSNVDRLTRPNIYAFSHQPAADGSLYLILSPTTAA